jgi:hypothetical protein
MSRWISFALVVLLSLQSAFALAASYCEHERAPAHSAHFGHHDHQHDDASGRGDVSGGLDPDCAFCHLHAVAALQAGAIPLARPAAGPVRAAAERPPLPVFLDPADPPPIASRG